MGEIVRMIAVECAEKGLLFNGQVTPELAQRERFYTKFVSEIEEQASHTLLDPIQFKHVQYKQCKIM